MSVYAFIMRGEFDDTLQWPFTGRVTVDMYRFKLKKWTQIQVINFKEYPIERGFGTEATHCKTYQSLNL